MIDGNEKFLSDGILRIIWGDKCKTMCVVDKTLSLNDCLKIIEYENGKYPVVIVIFEETLQGYVFAYGNYDDMEWHTHGKTYGYA